MNQRAYKIRSFSNGKNRKGDPFVNYSLTIPSTIAEKLPKDMQFYCELTEDGLLFRPVPPDQEQVVLPPWAQSENGSEAKEAKPKPRKPRQRPVTRAATKVSRSKPKSSAKREEPSPEPTPEPEDTQAEQSPDAVAV
jgi:outer membrane biosynthesis protein TonB